jgi:hypothetical protein
VFRAGFRSNAAFQRFISAWLANRWHLNFGSGGPGGSVTPAGCLAHSFTFACRSSLIFTRPT